MGLSRLDNFLKSVRGTILYVDPNSLDSTDSIENQGNSLTRPFKTIQRALVESSRFSYQVGLDNDRFDKTTILIYPGDHIVDNRPGWIPDGQNNYRLRSGATSDNFPPFDLTTIFDLSSPDNQLYKLNSIHGGVIIPRGTSLVGLDLRKTKIRPKYVPNPTNDDIERSCVFRVTGACYFWQFSLFDADPNGQCYVDYTNNLFVPNFSHHKLSCFEYADGVNDVSIADTFQTYVADRTDLEMYYEKVGLAYGQASGRQIQPDYASSSIDIHPKIDEYRIVGPTGGNIGITSIRAGDGVTSSTTITVTLEPSDVQLDIDTAFIIENVTDNYYDGKYVVTSIPATNQITYQVQNPPTNPNPQVTGATLSLLTDTVTSASPYVFNVSLRSVYGMCGVLSDGDKATGFKSMVLAQFTGISLQKDDNAFVVYNPITGVYDFNSSSSTGKQNLSSNSRAIYKPAYESFHIKTINDAYIQNVSIFAIGFHSHFNAESGGDQSINNSNSNFGSKSLLASGFKRDAFPRDNSGYITHVIPPREIETLEGTIEFIGIDVAKTVGVASTSRLYLYNETNASTPPQNVLQGYRVGAKTDDTLNVLISSSGSSQEYSANIVMPDTQGSVNETISIKSFQVGQSATGVSSISSNIFTLTQPHTFIDGESVQVKSSDGSLPDGVLPNLLYYVITNKNGLSGITSTTEIKLAKNLNDAINANPISINNRGGHLTIESRVVDKVSGSIGHPIQYDTSQNNWYINVSSASTQNSIYSTLVSLGTTVLGESTPRSYLYRKVDPRGVQDTIYRLRYVIPAESAGRTPIDGFIIQESSTTIGLSDNEVATPFSPTQETLSSFNQLRNFRIISNASWDGTYAYFDTELPHELSIGSQVSVLNVVSSTNTSGKVNFGFNRNYNVVGISSRKQFTVGLTTNPGTFTNNVSIRTTSLPRFVRKKFNETFIVYRSQEIRPYISGEQDGVYHLLVVNASNSPSVAPFTGLRFSQPIQNLYPQLNRDNPVSDPKAAASFALSSPIGQVVVDEQQNSITKESLTKGLVDFGVGIGLADIVSSSTGIAHTFHTTIDHGFNAITSVDFSIAPGLAYGVGSGVTENYYNAKLVGFAGSITGANATARITVNGSGSITAVKIIDGGSAYGIGNTLAVVGVATTSGFVQGYVTVTSINDSIGECLTVTGVVPDTLDGYNTVYKITNIPVGNINQLYVESASIINNPALGGIGVTAARYSRAVNAGKSIDITTLAYNNVTGISTITTVQNHGLSVGNKITIGGANSSLFNSDFLVKKVNSLVQFETFVGIGTTSPDTTGTKTVYINAFGSQGGAVSLGEENISGRLEPQYAGTTTTLSEAINTATTDAINLTNVSNLDLNIGDCLMIDSEIVRIKKTVFGNPVFVFRGTCGTDSFSHSSGSVVRKIKIRPIELRRNSMLRASGHTFEYVGFGPGNYSTAFPNRQDRVLSDQEELLAQSFRENGGLVVFTGMNDRGSFYVGNKKVNSATGQEQVFDSPIPTVTGEDILSGISIGFDALTPLEISVSRSIRVEGGTDGTLISEFDGPVIFNGKITSNSLGGIEANNIFLQGDASISRKYTVGVTQPTIAGNPGDIVYYANPSRGGHAGWIYTLENDWYPFGNIGGSKDSNVGIFDQIGISTISPGNCTLRVGSGSSLFCVNSGGVGIATTSNGFKLNVTGNVNIGGTITASYFSGDGSQLTSLNVPASGWTNISGGIYNTNLNNVGIGTSVPRFNLELGAVGSSSTSLYVNGRAIFAGFTTTQDVIVGGMLTSMSFRLDGSSSNIRTGIITTTTLNVGTGGTVITASSTSVGIGTTAPRAKLDIEGHTRLKTYSENVEYLSIVLNVVNVDLSKAQSFICTATSNINQFILENIPSGSTQFTIKIDQDSTGGRTVGIDTFRDNSGNTINVYWPGGGVLPIVTPTANRSDIYTFKTFDGSNIINTGLYGVVVGQNFAN